MALSNLHYCASHTITVVDDVTVRATEQLESFRQITAFLKTGKSSRGPISQTGPDAQDPLTSADVLRQRHCPVRR